MKAGGVEALRGSTSARLAVRDYEMKVIYFSAEEVSEDVGPTSCLYFCWTNVFVPKQKKSPLKIVCFSFNQPHQHFADTLLPVDRLPLRLCLTTEQVQSGPESGFRAQVLLNSTHHCCHSRRRR